MANNMKLVESISNSMVAAKGKKKRWYLKGAVGQLNTVNNNGRVYPEYLRKMWERYDIDFVKRKRALGSVDHPEDVSLNTIGAACVTEKLDYSKDTITGKIRLLNTEEGKYIQTLAEEGIQLAVSTRVAGRVEEDANGIMVVQPGAILTALDIVMTPGAEAAFVSSILENKKLATGSEVDNIVEQLETTTNFNATVINLANELAKKYIG